MNKSDAAEKKDRFGSLEESAGIRKESGTDIMEIPLTELHEFNGHPFRVLDDGKMEELVDSIQENDVLVPGIARPRAEGGYEIVSGHRRKRACELAGFTKMPMFVKNLTDEDAILEMVDSNIQRENISHSEKAKAYQMRYNAMKVLRITEFMWFDQQAM